MNESETRLVVYTRTPHFLHANSLGSKFSKWDPYLALGLPRESLGSLIELASMDGDTAEKEIEKRQAAISDAYRQLSPIFHPDAANKNKKNRSVTMFYNWIPIEERFSAIAVAANLLRDLSSTLEYFAALYTDDAERLNCVLNILRWRQALKEREDMASRIRESRNQMITQMDGLVIYLGLYGDLRSCSEKLLDIFDSKAGTPYWYRSKVPLSLPSSVIDVTGQLQVLVETTSHSGSETTVVHLQLPAGTKSNLEGFWDCCDGYPKQLLVRYAFLGRLHQVIIDDELPLRCPLKKHAIPAAPAPTVPNLRLVSIREKMTAKLGGPLQTPASRATFASTAFSRGSNQSGEHVSELRTGNLKRLFSMDISSPREMDELDTSTDAHVSSPVPAWDEEKSDAVGEGKDKRNSGENGGKSILSPSAKVHRRHVGIRVGARATAVHAAVSLEHINSNVTKSGTATENVAKKIAPIRVPAKLISRSSGEAVKEADIMQNVTLDSSIEDIFSDSEDNSKRTEVVTTPPETSRIQFLTGIHDDDASSSTSTIMNWVSENKLFVLVTALAVAAGISNSIRKSHQSSVH